jgi:chorismate dehydratase
MSSSTTAPSLLGAGNHSLRTRQVRLGVVSFVNTLPLIDGLDRLADVELRHSVPSLLLDQLVSGEVDVALCSSIDYQRSPTELVVLPVGMLGCDGATLTVRLYSTLPIESIAQVFCDTDSHTSVALLRILLKELHGLEPVMIDYDAREHVAANKPLDWPEAMLLIGDKVVTDSPPAVRYPHQLDLGAAWKDLTGLPFVFALWMARADADPAILRAAWMILDHQRRHNHERIDGMIHRQAVRRGWPADLAADYLKAHIAYEMTDACLAGVELFFAKARQHGLIAELRPVTFVD